MSVTVTITVDAGETPAVATDRSATGGVPAGAPDDGAPPTLDPAAGTSDASASEAGPPPAPEAQLGSGAAGSPVAGDVAGDPPDDVLVAGDDSTTAGEPPADLEALGRSGDAPPAGDGPGL